MGAAPIGGGVLPSDKTRLDHTVYQARHTAFGERDLFAEPAHGLPTPWCRGDVDEDVEEDRGDADGLPRVRGLRLSVRWR